MPNRLIIKRPIISERTLTEAKKGIFTFEVALCANKFQIRQAIEELFGVAVVGLTTTTLKGKKRLRGRKRREVKEKDAKKARVRLKSGEKIDLFEVGQTK